MFNKLVLLSTKLNNKRYNIPGIYKGIYLGIYNPLSVLFSTVAIQFIGRCVCKDRVIKWLT